MKTIYMVELMSQGVWISIQPYESKQSAEWYRNTMEDSHPGQEYRVQGYTLRP